MKTHLTVNGKEIALFELKRYISDHNVLMKLDELLQVLNGFTFEKKEEQKPFSVDNTPIKIWHGTTLEQDNVGINISSKGSEWFLNVSGTTEKRVNITHLFDTHAEKVKEAALSRVLQALKS